MISVVIVAFNEGKVLKDCLDTLVGNCNEIILVDLESIDETIEIAKQYRARIFKRTRVEYVEKVRDFAISKALGEWILVLDPDERMVPTLWERLKDITMDNKYAAVNIPRKNVFFGHWIAHTNWWPDRHVRFFKKGQVKWSDKIHAYPQTSGKVLSLEAREDLAIVHFGYRSVSQFIDRQNRYSTIEADNFYREGIRFSWSLFFWKPLREFLVRFVKHKGFLDGFYGFALTYLIMLHQMQVMIKLWELEQKK